MAKKDLHPIYNDKVQVNCICGHTFEVSAAVEDSIRIETCPNCHPLYTGKQETKVVKGRMEKFLEKQKRMEAVQKKAA